MLLLGAIKATTATLMLLMLDVDDLMKLKLPIAAQANVASILLGRSYSPGI